MNAYRGFFKAGFLHGRNMGKLFGMLPCRISAVLLLGIGGSLPTLSVAGDAADEASFSPAAIVGIFKNSADQGEVLGQAGLAMCYFCGKGVAQDYHKAFFWAQKAAQGGNADAQFILGLLHHDGKGGVKKDFEKAFQWFLRSARQGNTGSQFQMGCFYDGGRVVERDERKAMEWFERAAKQGNALAQFHLGKLYGRQENREESYKWVSLAAEKGNAEAQYLVGFMCMAGVGTKMDAWEGCLWWVRAARHGHREAIGMLEKMGKEELIKDESVH